MDTATIKKQFSALENIHESIANAFTGYLKKLDLIRMQTTVSVGASGAETQAAHSRAQTRSQEAKAAALTTLADLGKSIGLREAAARSEIELGLGLRLDSEDVQENLLRENRMSAAWNRIKPILDGVEELDLSGKISELAGTFGEKQDADAIAALRREIPLYVQARSPEHGDFITNDSADALDSALAGSNPQARTALDFKRRLDGGIKNLRFALSSCEHAIEHNDIEIVVPSFGGENFVVSQTKIETATSQNAGRLS